jgi:cell surface protein SprA
LKYLSKYQIAGFLIAAFVNFANTSEAAASIVSNRFPSISNKSPFFVGTTILQTPDTVKLPYPIKPEDAFAADRKTPTSFNLSLPPNIIVTVDYDPKTRQYTIYERVGKFDIKPPRVMSEDEYRSYQFENSMRDYWQKKSSGQSTNAGSGLLPRIQVGGETFDRIFGSNTIEIIPQGNAELSFGINSSKQKSNTLTLDQQNSTTFDFKSKIQMNVDGKIGEKLKMNVQYNTEATFDFENNVKVEYTGFEDEIIQKIEAGNVALPLPGTLITGSQSLFGFKTQLKFGKLNITTVFSKQNGQTQVIEVKGGAQSREFSISADKYEANRHFFLSQHFRKTYNETLKNLPILNTGVVITKVEVWISNRPGNYDNSRDIVGFVDIGELPKNPAIPNDLGDIYRPDIFKVKIPGNYPDRDRNDLYYQMTTTYEGIRDVSNAKQVLLPLQSQGFEEGVDYEKIENARMLQPNEYTFNPNLGYISLSTELQDDYALAVAYEYTVGGQIFKVGEFSTDGIASPKTLILKLLKGKNTLTPSIPPTWSLMMKNIYSLEAYQVSPTDFRLDVLYQNDAKGTSLNYLEDEGPIKDKPLIRVLNLDNMDTQGNPNPDGVFDFIDGVTINATNARIIFPVLEPFGKDLKEKIGNSVIADKYIYQELYDSTITMARQVANKNKFKLEGTFQSSMGSEISLNAANIPKGSVIVTAAGSKLVEGTDYTVDYNMGSVKIIKPGLISSGTPIKISLENNSLFNFQTKTLVGTHLDYQISDKFNVGATVLNLTERPLTQKVNFGNEAISNTIWGLNTSFQTESSFLTKAIDFLPFIQTKEKSTITFDAEFAQFLPGYSKAIGKSGTVFIDDFESSTTPIDMLSPYFWKFSSIPQSGNELFPEASANNDLSSGYNRAKLAWYTIDPQFPRNTAAVKFSEEERSSQWVREIYEQELFPYKKSPQGQPTNLSILNIAFYPRERGLYNYNTNLDVNGFLKNPKESWGGIMRYIGTSDFEAQNIEYIEFWLMDPFVYDTTGAGDLYFNLGNISEDILLDGKKAFEGGLPITSELKNVDTTVWGRRPKITSIPNVFVTGDGQKYQDIGLDGLSSKYDVDGDGINDEEKFFEEYLNQIQGITNGNAFEKIRLDPSNDDYKYFLDQDYNTREVSILDRYKDYNNLEGNTPNDNSGTGGPGAQFPDIEDINGDQNMSTTESYFQYQVSLSHDKMNVGENYITSKVYSSKQKINWYQFKIPIKDYKAYGYPSFTSISYARMFLKGFSDTLMLRFAKLQLVRGEWRKYGLSMIQGQEGVPGTDLATGSFDISSVNLEDNSSRSPVNYVLPPGLSRTTDPNQNEVIEQNEQAMEYKVLNLADGDARAGFKNVNLDIRQYRTLNMDVHAEAIPGFTLNDGDVSLFIRLGTDYTNNYYEYEVPLKVTPEGRYNNNKEEDRLIVWPRENFFTINLESLTNAKLARNDAMHRAGSSITLSTVFVRMDGEHKIKVTGNPNLGAVKILMIGVRNSGSSGTSTNDGLAKSAIIWVNELRLSNTDNKAGWAANARLSAKLADLGMVTIAGSTIKPGFGSIESKVGNRSTSDFYQYDLSATLEMGKFFPTKAGIKIPLYVGYSESFSNPEYNPLDPDIKLKTAINRATTKGARDTIKNNAQDYTRRKSINLTNVKIDRTDSKPWPLALSNFSVSYSFSELLSRNIKTDHKINREIRGALTYNYSTNSKPIVPLKNAKWLSSKYLRLIKDFNFNPIPSQFSFRTDLNRSYYEQQLRNITNPNQIIQPTYSKDFLWNRVYTLNWDITQSIKFDFNANNIAQIDEPIGIVDRKYRDSYMHWRDSVLHNILNFGRTKEYNHQFNISYTLPLNKIPGIDWTSVTTRYTGNYRWEAGPILPDTSRFDPGNTIQNSNTIQLMGQLNLLGLYNKVGYLKRLNQKFDQMGRGNKQQKMNTIKYEVNDIKLKANTAKSINHRLKADKVTVKVYNDTGAEVKVVTEIKTNERITIKTDKDYEKLKVVVEGKVPERTNAFKYIAEGTLRILMGVKTFSASYSQNNGTFIPGYKPTTKYFGMNSVNGAYAPGFEFISGWQDPEFAWKAIQNGWLSKDTTINKPVTFTNSENLTFRTTFEPIPNFKVELNAIRTYSTNLNEYYRANSQGVFDSYNPLTSGNFSMSVISLGTAFKSPNSVFNEFRNSRITIANRYADIRDQQSNTYDRGNDLDKTKFPNGYSATSQQVLIPAFLATYADRSPSSVTFDNFPMIPMPNWQITYDGLSKIKPFKNFLRTFSITHGYRSVYTIGAFASNLKYYEEGDGLSYVTNTINDFVPRREISNVSITEQFSPLIGMDMNWINSLTTRFEIKTGRSLSMSMSNNQLTEVDSWEYILGTGYRFENLPLIFSNDQGKQKTLKSDLRLRIDFSLRKNSTVLHKLVEEIDQVTSGQIATSIKASADYVISNQVTVRAFFDWAKNTPLVTGTSYPMVNTSFGFSLRFTMIQ